MPNVNSAENPRTKRTWYNVSGATMMPYMPNSANPITAAAVEIINSLPGCEDQKYLLSLTMFTLN